MKKLAITEDQVRELWANGVLSENSRLYLRRLGYSVTRREWTTLIKVQKETIKWEEQLEILHNTVNIKFR